MKAHFVRFFSPGTFIAEETIRAIDSWDVDKAVEMARDIVERHNARPYGFEFITRERDPDDLDSHITERKGTFYLGGKIETIEEVRERNDPDERTLLANMENSFDRIVVNTNSWKWTQPLRDGDVLLDVDLTESAEP